MDKQRAKEELRTLRDSITEVLGEKSSQLDSSEIKDSIEQAQKSAREGAKALKKSLIDRIKDLPVVNQVSQLGAAGTVAVSTAAVTQVEIAQDRTEIFVAEVVNDVVEERFEVPEFFETYIDFNNLNTWGQAVINEQIAEAKEFVEQVEVKVSPNDKPPVSSQSPLDSATSDEIEEKAPQEVKEEIKETEQKVKEVIEEKESSKEQGKSEKDQEQKEMQEEVEKKIPLNENDDDGIEEVKTPFDLPPQSPYM